MRLWTAQSTSLLGNNVSGFAVPSIAVTMLGATAQDMALMTIAGTLAFPLLGMFAATLVERWPKQAVMVSMDLGRMCAIGAIPLLAILHHLTMPVVVWVSCVVAVMSVFHDIAYQSQLPAVVPPERIAEGNTKLELTNTASQSLGPALAGILMHALSGPLAIVVNAASYLISALALGSMRTEGNAQPPRAPRAAFLEELWDGVQFVIDTPRLGRIALCTATTNFGAAMTSVASMLFLYHELHLQPLTVGLLFAFSNLGFVGALYAIKLSERIGLMPALSSAVVLCALGRLLLPFAAVCFPLGCALASLMLTSLAGPMYNVTQLSYRQRVTPLPMQARMHAAMRTLNSATTPLGAIAGGWCATTAGLQPTLMLAAFITAVAALWFLPIAHRTAGAWRAA